MAGTDDIQVNISCDASELTAGMTETRDQLEQTVISIQRQEQSWMAFGSSVIGSLARVAGPVISLISAQKQLTAATMTMGAASAAATAPTLTFGAAVNFLLSPIVLTTAAIAALSATLYYFSGAASDSSNATNEAASSMQFLSSVWQSAASAIASVREAFLAGLIGADGLDAIDELTASAKDLFAALGDLGTALLQPLKDAGFEIGSLAAFVTSFAATVRQMAEVVKSGANAIRQMANAAKEGIAVLSILAVMASTGANADAAAQMVEQRAQQREAQIKAFRARLAGPQMADQTIPQATPVDAMIKRNEQAIRELSLGQKEAAISAAILEGATAAQTDRIREQLDEIEAITEAKKAQKAAEEAMLEAARKQSALMDQTMSDLDSLADRYDVLTGAADKYDIKRRQLEREGRTKDEIDALLEMQKEVDKLEESKGQSRDRPLKAALKGSSEAASIVMRGIGIGDPQLNEQKKTNSLLGQVVVAMRDNKPPDMDITNLGVA